MSWTEVDSDKLLEPPLVLKDFVKAVKGARPTVSQEDIKRNADWTAEFGSEGGWCEEETFSFTTLQEP